MGSKQGGWIASPRRAIESGPDGETTERRPEFTFAADEAGSSFECRFDEASFAACSGATSERPAADLSFGPHAFEVRAIDEAGNAGPAAARAFTVTEKVNPPDGHRPTLGFGKVKLNRKKGFAVLPARVNQPGTVALLKSKAVKPQRKKAHGPSTVRLRVAAKGKALRKLRRRGKVKVVARVRFTVSAGNLVTKKRPLTLKLKKKKRR